MCHHAIATFHFRISLYGYYHQTITTSYHCFCYNPPLLRLPNPKINVVSPLHRLILVHQTLNRLPRIIKLI